MKSQPASSELIAEYHQAMSLFQGGHYDTALDHIWRCISANPLDYRYQQMFCKIAAPVLAEQYLARGEKLRTEGRFTELIRLYDNAIKLRLAPQIFKIARREARQMERQFDYECRMAQELLSQEKYMKFQRQVDKLLEVAPQNPKVQALFSQLQQLKDMNLLKVAAIPTRTARKQKAPDIEIPATKEAVAKTESAPGNKGKATASKNTELNLKGSIQLLEDLEAPSQEDK